MSYYEDKLPSLRRIFGSEDVYLSNGHLVVARVRYPIINDVIILLNPSQYTDIVRKSLSGGPIYAADDIEPLSRAVQSSFGDQWTRYGRILEEHRAEFDLYFDLVDLATLRNQKVCDLGCGIGRWSFFLQEYCDELILVDFSDAIFVARQNLSVSTKAIFFMGDIKRLPFSEDCCDFLFSLGVLHHMPSNALGEVRALRKYAERHLIYLYYALDNRPSYFRGLYWAMDAGRRVVSSLRSTWLREVIVWNITVFVYLPFIVLGKVLRPFGLEKQVPLFEFYNGKSIVRIRQDVHDRFCTAIEHRYSRDQIMKLSDTFTKVVVSTQMPYWHFLCVR